MYSVFYLILHSFYDLYFKLLKPSFPPTNRHNTQSQKDLPKKYFLAIRK